MLRSVLPLRAYFDESAVLGALQDARTEEQSKNFVSGMDPRPKLQARV